MFHMLLDDTCISKILKYTKNIISNFHFYSTYFIPQSHYPLKKKFLCKAETNRTQLFHD